jgi:hypothetical protein
VLMLLSIPLIAIHEPPFGPIGLAIFIGAVVLIVRQQASAPPRGAPLSISSLPLGPRKRSSLLD